MKTYSIDKTISELGKVRGDIQKELNKYEDFPSQDGMTWTVIHACKRHIRMIDKRIEELLAEERSEKEIAEILQKIQEIINATEENNACIYYNDACDGKALNEIEKLVDYALTKTKKGEEK